MTNTQRPVTNRVSVTVRITSGLHERLKTAADERQLSPSLLAARAFEDYLERLVPVDELLATRPPSPRKATE